MADDFGSELTPAEVWDLRRLVGFMVPSSTDYRVPGANDGAIFADIVRFSAVIKAQCARRWPCCARWLAETSSTSQARVATEAEVVTRLRRADRLLVEDRSAILLWQHGARRQINRCCGTLHRQHSSIRLPCTSPPHGTRELHPPERDRAALGWRGRLRPGWPSRVTNSSHTPNAQSVRRADFAGTLSPALQTSLIMHPPRP